MHHDFNAELHARPSIYFSGMAFVEHLALKPAKKIQQPMRNAVEAIAEVDQTGARVQVEYHTEFVTVTRVSPLENQPTQWPSSSLLVDFCKELTGMAEVEVICRSGILVLGKAPAQLAPTLTQFGFSDTAASNLAECAAQVCSDFRVSQADGARIIFFNNSLNSYRLGRMVRRIYEIETYRCMALLALPEARRLTPLLAQYDASLIDLTEKNTRTHALEHKNLLAEISDLSGHVISVTAATRNRFGATAAYAKIVEERIEELRETHVPGFQRFGVFLARRFKPAVRTCTATALRLEQLGLATTHLLNLLQLRIQAEIEYQNAAQLEVMAERAATQIQIQRAVEGFSVIAISYYLLSVLKATMEAAEHAGFHAPPLASLAVIPIVLVVVTLSVHRVKRSITLAIRA